jgi:hypothetical protein
MGRSSASSRGLRLLETLVSVRIADAAGSGHARPMLTVQVSR